MGQLARLCHFMDPDDDSAMEKRHRSVDKSSLGLRCPKFNLARALLRSPVYGLQGIGNRG